MKLRDYIQIVRKRWMFLAFLALAGLAAAAVASLLATPRYQAQTLSFISVQSVGGQDLDPNSLQQGVLYTQNIVRSLTEAVNSPTVLEPVIAGCESSPRRNRSNPQQRRQGDDRLGNGQHHDSGDQGRSREGCQHRQRCDREFPGQSV